MMKQYLKNRTNHNKGDCIKTNKNKKKIVLAKHHFDEDYNFNFECVEIFDGESNYYKRLLSFK